MNKLLLSAYHLQKLRPKQGFAELHVLTDEPEKYPEVECRRMLAPWSGWLRIRRCQSTPEPTDARALAQLELERGQILFAICSDPALQKSWQTTCQKLGVHCIVPEFPPMGTLDNDLVREV